MKKNILIFGFLLAFLVVVPSLTHAAALGIVPDCPPALPDGSGGCGFNEFIQLISNFLNFLILLSIPVATISFAWAGILMVSAAGNESQIKQARKIFTSVLIGFFFVLTAWLIVHTITATLLNNESAHTGVPNEKKGFIDLLQ